MRDRKGSMELSVNAIVILVIAIVIMGLMIGFIRSKFTEVGGNLVTNEPDPQPASYDEPMTLSRETISTIPGGQTVLKANIYNPTIWPYNNILMNVTCSGLAAGSTGLTIKSGAKGLQSGEQVPFIITFALSRNVKGSYLCTVRAMNITDRLGVTTYVPINEITPRDVVLQIK